MTESGNFWIRPPCERLVQKISNMRVTKGTICFVPLHNDVTSLRGLYSIYNDMMDVNYKNLERNTRHDAWYWERDSSRATPQHSSHALKS